MQNLSLFQAAKLTSPNPVSLVCTQKPDGTTNLATVASWTCASFSPDMIVYVMAKTSYSGELVRNNKKVVLTVPGAQLAQTVLDCGSTTGRDTDKVKAFGVQMKSIGDCPIQIPVHTRLAIVCSLKEYHETGDNYLYLCDVQEICGDESETPLFAWDGYSKIAPARLGE